MNGLPISYLEASARKRLSGLLDAGSFVEFCPPEMRRSSPHLALLDAPLAFDDGVVTGRAALAGHKVLVAAQEGRFNGGAVGEVHGAKIRGLLDRALIEHPAAVLLLVDSGGVRLHEANAGLIAISEIMRAVLRVQAAGIPVFALVGGSCGAFGGMGIVTRLCTEVIMSEQGRLGLSGPEVIETVKGVDEFDSRDRALVWRVTGGKLRRALGEATLLVDDTIPAFRAAAAGLLDRYQAQPPMPGDLAALQAAQDELTERSRRFAAARDGREIWQAFFADASRVPEMSVDEFNTRLGEMA
ncbi:malonyl-S-ACP:biotin-protein carboxyltransferase MADC [Sideroxyarcus emersonii]|uniref:Malonyl-S-ACP:biotin-protein carboxyltransferase MADC n=1 Tax=Sideroxyarcus emersonii TaxID=2764705 RepID=A0AAN2BZQ8_9PROT|nr:biotin-independent malonate decarboxylase subunit beta [Sideroxyarcus emersonii]BCK88464.1 malonyl-S-ACP:biotin-protein carboxyltransferase MADC [Sideroxyarcus emersonii]